MILSNKFWRNMAIGLVVAAWVSPSDADTLRVDQNTLYFEGEIKAGDYDDFIKLVAVSTPPITLVLNSPGGDVIEARRIAEFVRHAWISTELAPALYPDPWPAPETVLQTPVRCDSACTIIFVAGVDRLYQINDQTNGRPALGFHRAFLEPAGNKMLTPAQSEHIFSMASAYYASALKKFGAPTQFIEQVTATRSDEVIYVGAAEFYGLFGELRILGDGIPWLEEYVSAKCGRHLSDEEYQVTETNYSSDEAQRLRDRIYSQLNCRNELRNSHQQKVLGDLTKK